MLTQLLCDRLRIALAGERLALIAVGEQNIDWQIGRDARELIVPKLADHLVRGWVERYGCAGGLGDLGGA